MEIAILGTDDFVTGFRLAGVRNAIISRGNLDNEVEDVVRQEDIGILVMDEEDMNKLNNKTKKMLDRAVRPVIVTITEREGKSDLRESIKRTLGVDLWK